MSLAWIVFMLDVLLFVQCAINVYVLFRRPRPPRS